MWRGGDGVAGELKNFCIKFCFRCVLLFSVDEMLMMIVGRSSVVLSLCCLVAGDVSVGWVGLQHLRCSRLLSCMV